jgi:hypothetical protein
MGQKPDASVFRRIGYGFGALVQNAIDAETSNTIGNIQKEIIGLAGGGVIPRTLSTGQSIGMQIGERLGKTLEVMMNVKVSETLQAIRQQFGKEGFGLGPGGGPGPLDSTGPDVFHGMGAERMWNFFKNKGLNDFAVAGIMGNARWESSFSPTARGKGKGPGGSDALGIFQWGETERWKDLVNWATSQNLNPWDYDTQLKFAWHEMQTTEKATIPAIQGATSAADAAEKFRAVYERSKETEQRRKDAAEGFYQQYKGKTYIPPITGGVPLVETSQFGWRWGRNHNGIDLQNKAGWQQTIHLPVTIKKGGVVEYAGIAGDGNGIVTIRHDDGSKTRYIHLNNFKVRTGQTVGTGTVIGRIAGEGEPGYGNSKGPHLHFEYINPQGKVVNPKSIYNNYVALGANIVPSNNPLSRPAPAQLGKVLSSTNVNGSTYTAREGGQYFKNGNSITKDEWDKAFGLQISSLPSTSPSIAYGVNQKTSYSENNQTLVAIQRIHIHHNNTLPSMNSGGSVASIDSRTTSSTAALSIG